MSRRVKTSLTLSTDLLSRLDAIRGHVPRSRWIEDAVEATLSLLIRKEPEQYVDVVYKLDQSMRRKESEGDE